MPTPFTVTLFRPYKYLFVAALCFCALSAFSQQKPSYSLLWRISGNGLTKPSYLFGTMHVKDKRVFNFSDSVMLCLQRCDRFALEVHPDTIVSKMFALMLNGDSSRSISKLLDKEQYDALAKKFEKKNGFPMQKMDPVQLESLMQPYDEKADDQVSFVDAYLYGIARTLNKNIYGLEDASAQIDGYYGSADAIKERLLDLIDDDTAAGMSDSREEMIDIYKTGDLDGIYQYVETNGMDDAAIVARNKVMVASMIKYMAGTSLFTAVGCAHLPGTEGVIALLRKAGYSVTRVDANFTGVANNYHIDYMKMNWPQYRSANLGYAVNFPGVPITATFSGFGTVIYADMANTSYYGVMAIPRATPSSEANRKELIQAMVKNMAGKKQDSVISRKDFTYSGQTCTEILMRVANQYMRMRVLFVNNFVYMVYAGSNHKHIDDAYMGRFLNSFTYFNPPKKTSAPWVTYTNTLGAFTVNMPTQPHPIIKEVQSNISEKPYTYVLNMYLSSDTANAESYLVRYNDYPQGTYLRDKTSVFDNLMETFTKMGKVQGKPIKIQKDGFEGREAKVILSGGYNSIVRVFVRGNRTYLLIEQLSEKDAKAIDNNDPFYQSFHLLPYSEPDYYTFAPDSIGFKIQMPAKPTVKIDSAPTYRSYLHNSVTAYATSPNSGGSYGVEYTNISPYFRVPGKDSLYKMLEGIFVNYSDSLLKTDTVLISGAKGIEITVQDKTTGNKERVRILVNGSQVLFLTSHLDNTELTDKTSEVFYTSLALTNSPAPDIDLISSKAEKICLDLGSADTLTQKKAFGALSYYYFTKDELPYVYRALRREYPNDTTSYGTRAQLIQKLEDVNNDSTANVLIKIYPTLKQKDKLKAAILATIPIIDKKAGYDAYMNLLLSDPPINVKELYNVFNPLSDSIDFAAQHFEQLLPLLKYPNLRGFILRTAKEIADSKNAADAEKVKTNYAKIITYAFTDLDNYLALKDSSANNLYLHMHSYMQLAAKVKDVSFTDKFTKIYLEKDPKGTYVSAAVVARINNRLPVSPLLVKPLLDSLDTRYDVLEAYNNVKGLANVPLKYRKLDEFAKLCLYKQIMSNDEDDGEPEKITLLGSIQKSGAVYYAFKYLSAGNDNELIGIVGPYKPGQTTLSFKNYNAYTASETLQTSWRQQAEKMIAPLLEANK